MYTFRDVERLFKPRGFVENSLQKALLKDFASYFDFFSSYKSVYVAVMPIVQQNPAVTSCADDMMWTGSYIVLSTLTEHSKCFMQPA